MAAPNNGRSSHVVPLQARKCRPMSTNLFFTEEGKGEAHLQGAMVQRAGELPKLGTPEMLPLSTPTYV